MKRILVIDPSQAVRETVALFLARDHELVQWDGALGGTGLADAARSVDLVISSAGGGEWTAELTRLALRRKVAVLILADSKAVATSVACGPSLSCLVKPFSYYDLKAAVERLLNCTSHNAPVRPALSPLKVSYLEFPFVSRATARLTRRFASYSLPVLIWGELGCGQDRVARAMVSGAADAGALLSLNGVDIGADYLKEKRAELAALGGAGVTPSAVLIEGLERLSLTSQSTLLNFLDEVEGALGRLRLIATANGDLLERVYRGEFQERLYHKLATLTLPLAPLRERRADIPALARWFAGAYAVDLGFDKVSFTPAAMDRLSDNLWFGNVNEFDMVIARTLAIHGDARVDAANLVFNILDLSNAAVGEPDVAVELAGTGEVKATVPQSSLIATPRLPEENAPKGTSDGGPALRLLVHELAHELKNPMVTIKTFAQLLAERYDDANFRARFQDAVDGDIERMNELLGVMTEFAGFNQPHKISIALNEHLHSALADIHDTCAKRQVRVGWKENGQGVRIMADAAQLQYALRNTLLAILSQTRMGSEIELALGQRGSLTISYLRESERIQSLVNYLSDVTVAGTENILPLRILLARAIIERSGGRIDMDQADDNREIVTMEFAVD